MKEVEFCFAVNQGGYVEAKMLHIAQVGLKHSDLERDRFCLGIEDNLLVEARDMRSQKYAIAIAFSTVCEVVHEVVEVQKDEMQSRERRKGALRDQLDIQCREVR